MVEISFANVHKYFGSNHVLRGVSFEVTTGERIGLIGLNGAGKTTVFNAIMKRDFIDDGFVKVYHGRTIGVLDQMPVYPDDYSVYSVLESGFHNVPELRREMRLLELEMDNKDETIVKRYGELLSEFEAVGGYTVEIDIKKVCNGLGIDEDTQKKPFAVLSGGEKTKINLARLMLTNPDILLLDEPTNHLDINTLEWFEEFLNAYKGTIVVISHDRYFLDKIATGIIEIENGQARRYVGNYTQYAAEREDRLEQEEARFINEQRKIKQLQAAANRMHDWAQRADNPSMHRRAFSMEKRIERMRENAVERPTTASEIRASFNDEEFASGDILTVEGLTKSFEGRVLFKDLTFTIRRGEHVALLGDNGTGKTTILNIVNNRIEPDEGNAHLGATVSPAFLEQNVIFDEPEATVLKTVMFGLVLNEEKARNLLARYNFIGDDVYKTVENLSGGEKSRLRLCLLMFGNISFLMLDEPTNHLDLQSREWIESAVEQFTGTLLFVSHDRYFISQFANRVIEIQDDEVLDFRGTYEQFIAWRQTRFGSSLNDSRKDSGFVFRKDVNHGKSGTSESVKNTKGVKKATAATGAMQVGATDKQVADVDIELIKQLKRLSPNQIAGRIAKAENEINALEAEKDKLENEMVEKAANYVVLQELLDKADEIDSSIEKKLAEWEALTSFQSENS